MAPLHLLLHVATAFGRARTPRHIAGAPTLVILPQKVGSSHHTRVPGSSVCHIRPLPLPLPRPGPSQASAHHLHPRPRGATPTAASSTWPHATASATNTVDQSYAASNAWPVYTGDVDPHAPVLDPRLSAADRAVLALAKAASSLSDREKVGDHAPHGAPPHQQLTARLRALRRAAASKSCHPR